MAEPRSTLRAVDVARRSGLGAALVARRHAHTGQSQSCAAVELREHRGCVTVVNRPFWHRVDGGWDGRFRASGGERRRRTATPGLGLMASHHQVTAHARLRSGSAVRARASAQCGSQRRRLDVHATKGDQVPKRPRYRLSEQLLGHNGTDCACGRSHQLTRTRGSRNPEQQRRQHVTRATKPSNNSRAPGARGARATGH